MLRVQGGQRECHLPGIQTQRYDPRSSRQVPSFWQGFESHSLMFTSQRAPVKPTAQSHRNEPGVFTQVPPCSQGEPLSWHSSISFVQSVPSKPGGHEHRYVPSTGLVSQIALSANKQKKYQMFSFLPLKRVPSHCKLIHLKIKLIIELEPMKNESQTTTAEYNRRE